MTGLLKQKRLKANREAAALCWKLDECYRLAGELMSCLSGYVSPGQNMHKCVCV